MQSHDQHQFISISHPPQTHPPPSPIILFTASCGYCTWSIPLSALQRCLWITTAVWIGNYCKSHNPYSFSSTSLYSNLFPPFSRLIILLIKASRSLSLTPLHLSSRPSSSSTNKSVAGTVLLSSNPPLLLSTAKTLIATGETQSYLHLRVNWNERLIPLISPSLQSTSVSSRIIATIVIAPHLHLKIHHVLSQCWNRHWGNYGCNCVIGKSLIKNKLSSKKIPRSF